MESFELAREMVGREGREVVREAALALDLVGEKMSPASCGPKEGW